MPMYISSYISSLVVHFFLSLISFLSYSLLLSHLFSFSLMPSIAVALSFFLLLFIPRLLLGGQAAGLRVLRSVCLQSIRGVYFGILRKRKEKRLLAPTPVHQKFFLIFRPPKIFLNSHSPKIFFKFPSTKNNLLTNINLTSPKFFDIIYTERCKTS